MTIEIEEGEEFPELATDPRLLEIADFFGEYLAWVGKPQDERGSFFGLKRDESEIVVFTEGEVPHLPLHIRRQLQAYGFPPLTSLTHYVLRRAYEKARLPMPEVASDGQAKRGIALSVFFLAPEASAENVSGHPLTKTPWADIVVGMSSLLWAGTAIGKVRSMETKCRNWWKRRMKQFIPRSSGAGRPEGSKQWYVEEARTILRESEGDYITYEQCTAWAEAVVEQEKKWTVDYTNAWRNEVKQARSDIQKTMFNEGIAYQYANGKVKRPEGK